MKSEIITSFYQVTREEWDRLTDYSVPFLDYDFLIALENAGCLTPESGWVPRIITIRDDANKLLAAMPCFLKFHSFGEFIFDFVWAEAYQRSGRQYYPKLVCAAPFTPASGSRVLLASSIGLDPILPVLLQAISDLAKAENVSSMHLLFCLESEAQQLTAHDFILRKSCQYHWHNPGYRHFNDYLNAMSSRNRSGVKRERQSIADQGITTEIITDEHIHEEHIEMIWQFYQNTHTKHGSPTYLNRAFFQEVARLMPERLLIVQARRMGKVIAGAFNFIKGKNLYGRYWGCNEEHRFLHFEVCLYRLIEYAIEHRLARFEAGAGGEHKIARGLVPEPVYSAHHMYDPAFQHGVAEYIRQESHYVQREINELSNHLPFKNTEQK